MPSSAGKTHRIDNYRTLADSLATLLFPHAEVVLHDLASQTVAYIANNLSRRQVGDESGLEDLAEGIQSARVLGPYEKLNWDGQRMRSITSVLHDEQGKPEYTLCINLNWGVLEQARDALNLFFQASRIVPQPDALFRDDWQERINTFLHGWLQQRQLALNGLSREHKRQLVEALYHEGAFVGRSAPDYVANVLGLGRATVYKYLKALKEGA